MEQKIIESCGIGKYNRDQIKALIKIFELEGESPRPLYNNRPDTHQSPEQYIKSMSIDEIILISPDTFADQNKFKLLNAMSIKQLEKLGQEGSIYQKETIKEIIKKSMEEKFSMLISAEIKDYINYNPSWQ